VEDENELPPFSPVFVEQLLHPSAHPQPDTNDLVLPFLHLDPLSRTFGTTLKRPMHHINSV
jgi:hypothetical protein